MILALLAVRISYAQKKSGDEKREYTAKIKAINTQLNKAGVSGEAKLIVADDQLKITMKVKGVSPGMHFAYIHGFITDKASTCPPPEADTNGDGIIDLVESEAFAETTLIPLNGAPIELKIKSDSYPVADKEGRLTYEMTVDLKQLNVAIKKEYGIDKLFLENRVIFIHRVPKDMDLPGTVQSLPGVPAYVTVPIACGKIKAM